MIDAGILNAFRELVRKAEQSIIEQIKAGEVRNEPSMTDRFAAELRGAINTSGRINGYKIRVTTLQDRGPKSEEAVWGADLFCVLDISIPEYKVTKGFLAQAKKECEEVHIGKHKAVSFHDNREFHRLKDQAEKMLSITPESFVFVYSNDGFVVLPALSVKSLGFVEIPLVGKPIDEFFVDLLRCFIGDEALNDHGIETLGKIKEERQQTPTVLKIQVSESD